MARNSASRSRVWTYGPFFFVFTEFLSFGTGPSWSSFPFYPVLVFGTLSFTEFYRVFVRLFSAACRQLERVEMALQLLAHQEQLPAAVLDAYGLDVDSMKVLTPQQLVEVDSFIIIFFNFTLLRLLLLLPLFEGFIEFHWSRTVPSFGRKGNRFG